MLGGQEAKMLGSLKKQGNTVSPGFRASKLPCFPASQPPSFSAFVPPSFRASQPPSSKPAMPKIFHLLFEMITRKFRLETTI
jgi:hypothetical protein